MYFFHTHGDFTPVCTTEMIEFSKTNESFKQRNTALIGLSIDSNSSHLAWVYDIFCRTGIRIPFPIIADRSGEIARKYGMISNNIDNTSTVRNVYIIDDKGIIRAILIYPMELGRNIPEVVRILDGLQLHDNESVSLPVNWIKGNPTILSNPKTYAELEKRNKEIEKNNNGISWYLSFKNE